MDEEPHHPAREPAEAQLAHAGDGPEPPDGRHAAEVAVLERHGVLALEPAGDRVGGVEPALHRHLGDAGQVVERWPCRRWRTPRDGPGSVRSGSTAMRPARSTVGAAGLGQHRRPAATPARRRPRSSVQASMRVVRAVGVDDVDARARRRRRPGRPSAARRRACSSSLVALPESLSPKVASGSLPPSSSSTRTDAGSKVRNSPVRLRTASSRTCPASSTPVGPAPTTTMVSQRSLLGRRRPPSRPSRRRRRCAGAAPARRRSSSCPARSGPARRGRSTTGWTPAATMRLS